MTGEKNGRNRIWRVVFWVALVVFAIAVAVLGTMVWSYWSASDRYTQIADQAFSAPEDDGGTADADTGDGIADLAEFTVDWDWLRSINHDIVGWVYIPGTVVNYPVVQGSDNEEYLNKNFDGQTGLATGCGTIFLDANAHKALDDDNEVVYGHHRNDGSMFAVLSDFADQNTFDAHRTIYLLTPKKNFQLRTFALLRTVGTDPLVELNFSTKADRTAYVADKMSRSVVEPAEGFPKAPSVKHIFTFATCDYNEENGRAVLFTQVARTATPKRDAADVVGTYKAATE